MSQVLEVATRIGTPVSLAALALIVVLLAYRMHVIVKARQAQALSDDDRLAYYAAWLNLPVNQLSKAQTFTLAEKTIRSRLIVTLTAIVTSSIVFLAFMYLILRPHPEPAPELDTACGYGLERANRFFVDARHEQAKDEYVSAISECAGSPAEFDAQEGYARTLHRLGRCELAIVEYRRALELAGSVKRSRVAKAAIFANIGYCFESTQSFDEARVELKRAVEAYGSSGLKVDPLAALGRIDFYMVHSTDFDINSEFLLSALQYFKAAQQTGVGTQAFISYSIICLEGVKHGFTEQSVASILEVAASDELTSAARGAVRSAFMREHISDDWIYEYRATVMPPCPPLTNYLHEVERYNEVMAALS